MRRGEERWEEERSGGELRTERTRGEEMVLTSAIGRGERRGDVCTRSHSCIHMPNACINYILYTEMNPSPATTPLCFSGTITSHPHPSPDGRWGKSLAVRPHLVCCHWQHLPAHSLRGAAGLLAGAGPGPAAEQVERRTHEPEGVP